MNGKYLNKIIHGDTLQVLSGLEDNSIDLVLTDSPYFMETKHRNMLWEVV